MSVVAKHNCGGGFLLGCDAINSSRILPTFRFNITPPTSGHTRVD